MLISMFFMYKNMISCLGMFRHVQHVQHVHACTKLVQSLFTNPENAEHTENVKIHVKNEPCVPKYGIMFSMFRHVQHVLACSELDQSMLTLPEHDKHAGTTGTIQHRLAGLERNYYQGGQCDSRTGAGDGSSVWYTCQWTMDWSEYD